MISLTENGKPILLNPEHIMYIGKGLDHQAKEVDLIVLSSGMSVKPDDIKAAKTVVWCGDGDELLYRDEIEAEMRAHLESRSRSSLLDKGSPFAKALDVAAQTGKDLDREYSLHVFKEATCPFDCDHNHVVTAEPIK